LAPLVGNSGLQGSRGSGHACNKLATGGVTPP
jgi:hypothetical protein